MDSFMDEVYDRIEHRLRSNTTDQAEDILRVPAAYFTDPEHLKKELEVFRRIPVNAAMSSELPEPGSFVTRDILGVPLLILRDKDGRAAAFRNMCRHRGAKVELKAHGKRALFMCSYHGWSYDASGALRGVPYESELGSIDKACNSLHSVPCTERHGMIWVNLSADSSPDIAAWFGPGDERMESYNVDRTIIHMEQTIDAPINWKLVMDGAIDVLHPQFLHPEGVGKLLHTSSALWVDYGRHGHSYSARKRFAEKVQNGEAYERNWRYLGGNFMVFPNMYLIPTPDHYEHWNVWPHLTDPGSCHIHIRFLIDPEKLTPEIEARIERSWEILQHAATTEDFPIEETIQQNAFARPDADFLYGRMEVSCQNLHRRMADEIAALPGAAG
jgi:phenylpropionate dioxygenase-like ring-hydroxylating dioxygenase large terminal subunit